LGLNERIRKAELTPATVAEPTTQAQPTGSTTEETTEEIN
jgi:hypothetical protein